MQGTAGEKGHEGVAPITYRMDLTGPAPDGLRASRVHVEQSVSHNGGSVLRPTAPENGQGCKELTLSRGSLSLS